MQALLDRIKALEDKQKPPVADLKKSIIQYASRPPCDFDKYKALEFIGNLKDSAANCKDKKADYYASVHSKLMEGISKPIDQFRSYILALLGDRDYEKIVESLAKVDKACQEMSAHLTLIRIPRITGTTSRPLHLVSHLLGILLIPLPSGLAFSVSIPILSPLGTLVAIPVILLVLGGGGGGGGRHQWLGCTYCGSYNHRLQQCFRRRDDQQQRNLTRNGKDSNREGR